MKDFQEELAYYKLIAKVAADSRFFIVNGPTGIPQLALNCNDLFYHATTDLELIPLEMTFEAFNMSTEELTSWAEGIRNRPAIKG